VDPDAFWSGVGRGTRVLDSGSYRRREGAVLGMNLGRSNVTNGDFVAYSCAKVREPFEVVSGVGRGMGVLERVRVPQWKREGWFGFLFPHWFGA